MSGDVCSALSEAKQCIEAGLYLAAVEFIEEAEKAWQVEVDAWAQELYFAEREIHEYDQRPPVGQVPPTKPAAS